VVRAEKGGFYCEKIFGPWDARDPDAFAHIELGTPLAHPWLPIELKVLPVLPAAYRAPRRLDGGFAPDDTTWLYGLFYWQERRCTRLFELDAPDEVVEKEWRGVRQALAALFDNEFLAEPVSWSGDRRPPSLASRLGSDDVRHIEAVLFSIGLRLERVPRQETRPRKASGRKVGTQQGR
jgi:DNA-directed RNA polymerase beta' subunit